MCNKVKGFTLIELVVGMVVVGIALTLIGTGIVPKASESAKMMQKVRSAELAHSIMNEMMSKKYDENSGPGGLPACDSVAIGSIACTPQANLGLDTSESFDTSFGRMSVSDIDDYNALNIDSLSLPLMDKGGGIYKTYKDDYENYQIVVVVDYPSALDKSKKIITITITTPLGEDVEYQSVRWNY